MKKKELEMTLREMGLSVKGNKNVLEARLKEALSFSKIGENDVQDKERKTSNSPRLSNRSYTLNKVRIDSDSDDGNIESVNTAVNDLNLLKESNQLSANRLLNIEKELLNKEIDLLRREKEFLIRSKRKPGSDYVQKEETAKEKLLHPTEIAEVIPSFNPNDEWNITSAVWIRKLEKLKVMYNWKSDTLLHYAGLRLQGSAKLWKFTLDEEVSTWNEFKEKFLKTFPAHEDESDIHHLMASRNRKHDESYEEFVFIMTSIGKRASLSEKAIIKYIIKGLRDPQIEEVLLFNNFANINDFLQHLKNYEANKRITRTKLATSHQQTQVIKNRNTNQQSSGKTQQQQVIRCFNCNQLGHVVTRCPNPPRSRGTCYHCGKNDHMIKDCPKKKSSLQTISDATPTNDFYLKCTLEFLKVKELSFKLEVKCLIDTGSPISIIKKCLMPDFVNCKTYDCNNEFIGINESKLTILGLCKARIYVNDKIYELTFYIVPNDTMVPNVLLGRDFLNVADATLNIGNVCVNKLEQEAINEILNIDLNFESKSKLNINQNLTPDVQDKVIETFKDCYLNFDKPEVPIINYEMNIRLTCDKIISHAPRRLSFSEKNEVKKITDDLLQQGIIRPSDSPYSSPIVLVKKKNGELRMCIDFRKLNAITERENFPLPFIEDMIDRLNNKRYFSKLDLKNSFHQVKVANDSIKFTSFVTPMGQFEYVRMPFGLKNSPSAFQRYIHKVFKVLIDSGLIQIYIDDIFVATEGINEHINILKKIFETLSENHLQLRLDKCEFIYEEIEYLGYSVSANGIKPNPEKLKAVSNFSIPKNVKELRSFLGLCSYFRKFIQNFSLLSKPLYDLVKKDVDFEMNSERLNCFELLKGKLVEAPILKIYSPIDYTELHCDASSLGFGAILLQKKEDGLMHPILYFSKRTTDYESKYHSYELETLAIIYALRRFRVYLQGIKFKVITDCSALTLTLKNNLVNARINRWILELQNFDFDIEHRSSNKMQHVDALSRDHNILVLYESPFSQQLAICQFEDPQIKILRSKLQDHEDPFYELRDDLVYRKSNKEKLLFYVPQAMVVHILRNSHDQHGHVGVEKVYEIVKRSYWFPDMKDKIKSYIMNCPKCIVYNHPSGKKEGFLHSIPKGDKPFLTLHIDHFGPLETTPKKKKYILVVIDGFTKFVKLYAVKTTSSLEAINCLKNYFHNYSIPIRIISDRGSSFTSDKFKNFLNKMSIQQILVASGSPKSNGQVERVNRDLTPMLSKLVNVEEKLYWDKVLSQVEFAFNNTSNRSVETTPSKLLFGVNQRNSETDKISEYFTEMNEKEVSIEEIRKLAAKTNEKVQRVNKIGFDKKRKPPRVYKNDDLVMITNVDTTPGVNKKLAPKYRGPYKVTKVLGNDRYVIKDVEGFSITNKPFESVYDVTRIKPYINLRSNDKN